LLGYDWNCLVLIIELLQFYYSIAVCRSFGILAS